MDTTHKDWAQAIPSCDLLIEFRTNALPPSARKDIATSISKLYHESQVNAFTQAGGGRLNVITEMPNLKTQALQFGDQLRPGGQTLLSQNSNPNRIDIPFDETCFSIDQEKANAANVGGLAHSMCEVRLSPSKKFLQIRRTQVPDTSNLPTLAEVELSLLRLLNTKYKTMVGPWYLYEFYPDSGPSGESCVNIYGVSRSGNLGMLIS